MNDEIRKLFSNLGSTYAKQLGFRDSWVFLGARDLNSKSPYEEVSSWQPPCPSEGGDGSCGGQCQEWTDKGWGGLERTQGAM